MKHRIRIYETSFDLEQTVDGEYGPDAETSEEVESVEPDRWDRQEGLTAVDMAVELLTDRGITEHSSSQFDKSGWYCDPDGSYVADYYTGERVEPSAHLEGFTDAEREQVYKRLTQG